VIIALTTKAITAAETIEAAASSYHKKIVN